MKRSFGKQTLCYLLSLTLFTSALQIPTGATEVSPNRQNEQSAIAQQGENETETTELTSEAAATAQTEKSLDFVCDGGTFQDGYQVPTSYPLQKLPDETVINKPGYAFAGWYDNKDFSGEAVTGVSDTDYTGPVVLYAKWTDPYYYVDIPATVATDGTEIRLSGEADGLYDEESVKVKVHSENDWNLKNQDALLSYQLKEKKTKRILENDVPVIQLTPSQKSEEKVYVCEVTGEAEVAGQYNDTLTFQIGQESQDYTIDYEANGGFKDDPQNPGNLISFESETLAPGTLLSDLPVAIKSGYTFLGWCYDKTCTEYVATNDRLLGDITLYASYTENQEFESHSIATFARAIDVDGASLVIQVTDQSGALSADQILNACTLKNLSDFSEEITLHLTAAGNNTYTISKENGWKEGSNYKLVLDDENLYFTGFDTTIREYEISIHKDEVKNVSLNPKIKYINNKELSNLTVNGQSAQSVSVATMTLGTDGTVKSEGSSTTGTFTYQGKALKVGDQIAIYEGDVIPSMDEVTSSPGVNGERQISFFEITSANGTNYSYRGSETEDVLFMPDVLPLDLSKDQDGDTENNSVTVELSVLTFDGSVSQNSALSADTTVDEGDYLALYTDINNQNTCTFGKITSVHLAEGNYILDYEPQTWEEVQAAMDVYATEPISGKDLLGDTDVEALESDIEAQAIASGFANDVAEQIGEMTIRTDSFAELEKSLGEELKANVEIQGVEDLEALTAAGVNKRVEVGLPQVKADLDTKLRHFDGNESGVHLGLEISVPITFHVARYADFTITVKATFEQEVRVAIHVDGEAVWKVWGIFPYIADYRVTASLDLYEYTGLGLEINIKTEQANNYLLFPGGGGSGGGVNATSQFKKKQKLANDVENIVNELEDMMENGKEYISDKSPVMGSINGAGIDDEQISVAKSLAERYADMLEDDGDWVEIYTRNIVCRHIMVLYIIDITINVDFVVWAKVNVSIGMTFWYKNAKRYVFTLHVKGRKATSDTINISEEEYEFTAYAMGTIGIKAGVRLTILVGLFSTDLAGVGLSAEVGGYVQLWGYLYYILKYAASQGRNTRAIGALYLEIGIYLDIKFRAQALANAFTYAPTLYEAMWPIYTAGTRENVLDFTDTDEIVCSLKNDIRQMRLPDDFFSMNYLDMKEGLDDGEYFTKIYEDDSDQYFKINMTNDAFSYDPETNFITVNPGTEKSVDGEMIVTWKNQPGTFNTNPFQKKVKLHWDMLRDGYVIAFVSNGGSYVAGLEQKYGSKINKPADPTKQGYTFGGWYQDEALTKPYTIPDTMPDHNTLAYAKWNPAKVKYTVKTYLQGVNGVYEVPEDGIETGKAYTDTIISPQPKTIEGYETPPVRSAKVEADGSTLIEYYYARNKYTATYKSDNEVVSTGSYTYGSMMPVPAVYKPGYDFDGWIMEGQTAVGDIPMEVPARDVTYYASWKPQSGIGYTVKYYVQEENGDGYCLNEIAYLTGETGATVTAPAGDYDSAIYHLKDNAALPSGEIKADGSLELRVYYDLNTYHVTYDLSAADATMPDGCEMSFTARPGQKILTQAPEREGYEFAGWYLDADYNQAFDDTMPRRDITLYAKWERIQVTYTVRHYQENLAILNEYGYPDPEEGEPTYTLVEEEVFTASIGAEVTPAVKDYEGFTAPTAETKTVTVDAEGNGTLVIDYKYSRIEYTISWVTFDSVSDDMASANEQQVQYGAPIIKPDYEKEIVKIGYRVDGWYEDSDLTKPFTYETMPAQNLMAYPKWVPVEIEYFVHYEFLDVGGGDAIVPLGTITETLTGLADSEVEPPEVKTFEGYTFDESTRLETYKIDPDPDNPGVTYKYNINTHTLTYQYETGSDTATKKYGENITRDNPEREGYAFAGWYTDENFTDPFTGTTMPDRDLTLYGKWEVGKQSYQVMHYLKQLDDSESLYLVENLSGTLGDVVTPESKAPEGFENVTPDSHTLIAGSVSDNCIQYVYPRKQYQVTYQLNGGTSDKEAEILAYEAEVENNPYRNGYYFTGWYTDESLQTPLTDMKMPARDLTLYAGWRVLESLYKVEHYKENAETGEYELAERIYSYADTDSMVEPAVKQYDGYQSPSVQSGIVAGDIANPLVIQYKYDCNKHTLTLHDAVGADNLSVEDVTEEKKYGSRLPSQTRKNYNFGGWYKDAAYTEEYKGMMPDEDLTLYAKWTAKMCNYEFIYQKQNLKGYYDDKAIEKIVRGTAQLGTYVTPEQFEYEGFTSPDFTPVEISANPSDNVFRLQYPRETHTVTFKLDNGKSDVVQEGYFGSEIDEPEIPKKEGYFFVGWDKKVADTIPAEDVTYTAKWKIGSYHIGFIVDGNDLGATYEYGQRVSKPANPTKKGYVFKGWNGTIPATMPAKDLNFAPVWEPETYKITYDLGGGTMQGNPTTYTYESNVIYLKEPTKSHYEFLGWSEEGKTGLKKNGTIPKNSTGNRRFKANWKVITYKISFVTDETALNMDDFKTTYFETKKLPKCAKVPKGYSFGGWSLTKENQTCAYSDENVMTHVDRDMTLYPIFVPKKFCVTFDYNTGKWWKEWDWYDYESTIPLPKVEKNDTLRHKWGYVLDGWNVTNLSGVNYGHCNNSYKLDRTEDVTLTADWQPNAVYTYTPSSKNNTYNITDGKNREISFTFHVDGQQKKQKVTGDYGLGNGADYVINMDNMSYNAVSKNFKKIKVNVKYKVSRVENGYAVMRLKYKTKDGKEVLWKTVSVGLNEDKTVSNEDHTFELDRTDVTSFTIEFDAEGKGKDEHNLKQIKFGVTYLKK